MSDPRSSRIGGRGAPGPNTPTPNTSRSRPCPCCEGAGCSECDGTGQRVTTYIERPDGSSFRVSGNAELSEETTAALSALADAALKREIPHEPDRGEGV